MIIIGRKEKPRASPQHTCSEGESSGLEKDPAELGARALSESSSASASSRAASSTALNLRNAEPLAGKTVICSPSSPSSFAFSSLRASSRYSSILLPSPGVPSFSGSVTAAPPLSETPASRPPSLSSAASLESRRGAAEPSFSTGIKLIDGEGLGARSYLLGCRSGFCRLLSFLLPFAGFVRSVGRVQCVFRVDRSRRGVRDSAEIGRLGFLR